LAIGESPSLSVYIYPDRRSKATLTGNGGDGHADVSTRSVHVVRFDPAAGGVLEQLVMHEGAHVFCHECWGPAGSPLLGEGVAVWAAGSYGGIPLSEWKRRLREGIPPVTELLGKSFRSIPEGRSYPVAGLFLEAAVKTVGIEQVRDYLYGASPASWEASCRRAGATPEQLEAAFRTALARD
jgi:hypothetical protein